MNKIRIKLTKPTTNDQQTLKLVDIMTVVGLWNNHYKWVIQTNYGIWESLFSSSFPFRSFYRAPFSCLTSYNSRAFQFTIPIHIHIHIHTDYHLNSNYSTASDTTISLSISVSVHGNCWLSLLMFMIRASGSEEQYYTHSIPKISLWDAIFLSSLCTQNEIFGEFLK